METQLSDVYKVIGQRNRVAFLSPATYGSCSTRPLIPCLLYHASVVVQVIKKLDKNSKYFSYMNSQEKIESNILDPFTKLVVIQSTIHAGCKKNNHLDGKFQVEC